MHTYPFMRTLVPLSLVAVLVSAGAFSYKQFVGARWASRVDVPTISVVGEAKEKVVPDMAVFNFGVLAEHENQEEAQRQAATLSETILSYLKEQGIEDKYIQTSDYSLYPRYEYNPEDGSRRSLGYSVSQNVIVKVKNKDKAGEILGGVGSRGATNISSLSFITDDTTPIDDTLRAKAIENARVKAEILAEQLGVRLGEVVSFSEGGATSPIVPFAAKREMLSSGSADAAVSVPVMSGENEHTMSVTVTYRIR